MPTQKINKEYHANGTLAYIETINILDKNELCLFDGIIVHPDGYRWFRSGVHAKYFDNGQLAWMLEYDANGKSLESNKLQFKHQHRKDGTIITC